jgi:hypothetical protein
MSGQRHATHEIRTEPKNAVRLYQIYFICGLCNDAVSDSNDHDEQWSGKDMEGNGRCLV